MQNMTCYSVQQRDRIFVRGYKNGKNIGKDTNKNLSSKCSQNLLQMHLKMLQKEKLRSSRSNWWLIGNKIADRITSFENFATE